MNKRIEELASAAGADYGQIIANVICGVGKEFQDIGVEFNKLSQETRDHRAETIARNQEKFAELIVKECAKVMNDNDFDGSTQGDVILDHFGIKHD